MPLFHYEGRDGSGPRSGSVEAPDRRLAIQAVRAMGVTPIHLAIENQTLAADTKTAAPRSVSRFGGRGIKSKEVTRMTRQLATLLEAGFPLARALVFMRRQQGGSPLARILGAVDQDVRAGRTLSESMADHPQVFDVLYLSMVRAGESGGVLQKLVDRLAAMRESDEALMSSIRGAMTYPALMLTAMGGSVLLLFTTVIPRFAVMFADMGQEMPMATRVMIDLGEGLTQYWPWLVGPVVAIPVAAHFWGRTPNGRLWLDQLRLKTPVLGGLVMQVAMARFCRTLGTLMDSGVDVTRALNASRQVAGNEVISQVLADVTREIREGRKFGETLKTTKIIPDLVCEMVALGEEASRLPDMLERVAQVYEKRLDDVVKGINAILEPAMILLMGVIVGGVVMAMLMPIFEMNLMAE